MMVFILASTPTKKCKWVFTAKIVKENDCQTIVIKNEPPFFPFKDWVANNEHQRLKKQPILPMHVRLTMGDSSLPCD